MNTIVRMLGWACIAAASACASPSASAGQASAAQVSQPLHEYCFDGARPQQAAADDMHLFDPYIGRFRGTTQHDDANGRDYYFTVEYAWFDAAQRVVRFRVALQIVGEQTDRTLSEGFYGYDAFNERLYVLGVFASGVSGFGAVGEFDRQSHRKSTWACQIDAAGARTYVRDSMEMIDAESWRNVTRIRQGEAGEWIVVTDEIMTRMRD